MNSVLTSSVVDSGLILGADPGGGHTRHVTTTPPPPKIGKNMIFWHKIVIFHTKYPKNVHSSLHSAQFFLSTSPLT
jgi:hypothetical protein